MFAQAIEVQVFVIVTLIGLASRQSIHKNFIRVEDFLWYVITDKVIMLYLLGAR